MLYDHIEQEKQYPYIYTKYSSVYIFLSLVNERTFDLLMLEFVFSLSFLIVLNTHKRDECI